MNILRACLNWRVVAVLVAVSAGVTMFAPNLIAAAVPLLIVAACPLSMLVMMRTMTSHQSISSLGRDPRSGDRPSLLRERLAATRLEQQHLEQELARLETAEPVPASETPGSAPAAQV